MIALHPSSGLTASVRLNRSSLHSQNMAKIVTETGRLGGNGVSSSLEAGKLYYLRWPNDGMLYLCLIVPWHRDNARRLGIPVLHHGIKSLGLLDRRQVTLPECYIIDRRKGTITGWAEGYENGGPRESEREFPGLFFDKP